MNEYQLKNVQNFESQVQPFLGLWKSLVIRIGWVTAQNIDMVVYLNVTFETDEPEQIKPPKYSPAVDGFHVNWLVKPAIEIPSFIQELKSGVVSVDDKKIKLGQFRQGKWFEGGFGWSTFAQKGRSPFELKGRPSVYMQESGGHLAEETSQVINLPALKAAWLTLPHPYKDISEVFQEYFCLKAVQSEGIATFVHALFPLEFTNPSGPTGSALSFHIEAPATVDLKSLAIGQIITFVDGSTKRGELPGAPLDWVRDGKKISAVIPPLPGDGRIQRAHAILRYGKLVLDESDIENAGSKPISDIFNLKEGVVDTSATLSADRPLSDPSNDRFGYAPFAKRLAESITKMTPVEGLVIGLYGPWGSGKSTLTNFLLHYLQELPEAERPVVVQFNPWMFSGHEDLANKFFDQLLGILAKWGKVAASARGALEAFAKRISDVPVPGSPWFGWFAKLIHREPKTVVELKSEIQLALSKHPKRLLVVIDDIDRLVAEEIRQVFRLVKAVADFPNITYLLVFDKKVAIDAIAELQHASGEDYLEKIVQVPFELPKPDASALRRLLFEKLNAILAGTPSELFDSTLWGNLFFEAIDQFITTPRDVMRLTNTLRVTYAAVIGEVHAPDFIAVECLRIFCPDVYEIVRSNPEEFTGYRDRVSSSRQDELKLFHDAWINAVDEKIREPIKCLALRLFPKLESVWKNTVYGPESMSRWRKALRVCAPEVFPVYFRLAIPAGSISASEMRLLLALGADREAFASKLLALSEERNPDGTTRLRTFLERLLDHIQDELPPTVADPMLRAFFDIGDDLMSIDEPYQGMADLGMKARIGRAMWRLLKRIDKSQRARLLTSAIIEGRSPEFSAGEIAVLGQQHGKYGGKVDPEREQLITLAEQEALEQTALGKIREAAQSGRLRWTDELVGVLHRWADWGSEAEVKAWVATQVASDESLIKLLGTISRTTHSHTISDSVSKSQKRLNPNWLKRFIDPGVIAERLKAMGSQGHLAVDSKAIADQFLLEYGMIQDGKDPDAPFAWRD